MRELKFRAWDKENECWLNFGYASIYRKEDGEPDTIFKFDFSDSYIVEQYTGLKDKNGKEIYEGDIFRNTINGGTWRVNWDENDAAFWVDSGVAGCGLGEFNYDRGEREYGFIRKNCEVIGNIHENPELLGGGE